MQERHCNKNCCTQQTTQNTVPGYVQQNCGQQSPKNACNLAYALYYQLDEITVAANDGIDLPLTAAESAGDFLSDGNQVQILQPGVYHISYRINIPAETTVTTTFALQANRQNVAGTERAIAKTGVDTPTTVTAETILTVCTPVSIRVISTTAVTIIGEEDEVLASLLIEQLA